MYVYIPGNGFLLSSELQGHSLAGLRENQCTSSFLSARIAVDAERKSYTKRRDDCIGVTEDKERCPNGFHEGGRICTSYEAGEGIATKSVSWHDQDSVYELQRSALTCLLG